jgi:predicted permease
LITGVVSNGGIKVDRREVLSTFNFVGPDFFKVMEIPVILGRGIELRDTKTALKVAVINEALARDAFGGESPLGRRFRWWSGKEDVEIIGVVKDAHYDRLREEPPPTLYAPYTQCPFGWPQEMSFVIRTAGNTAEAVTAARRAVAEVDRMLPLAKVKTQEAQIDEALAQERLFASLVSLFGAITLALAAIGLYGLVSYSVTSRTREIGIRMALGAGRLAVLRMLMGQVSIAALIGLTIGLPATWALTRIIESQLFGIRVHDPLSLAGAAVAVLLVAAAAALLPARRAMHIDPVGALRYE